MLVHDKLPETTISTLKAGDRFLLGDCELVIYHKLPENIFGYQYVGSNGQCLAGLNDRTKVTPIVVNEDKLESYKQKIKSCQNQ